MHTEAQFCFVTSDGDLSPTPAAGLMHSIHLKDTPPMVTYSYREFRPSCMVLSHSFVSEPQHLLSYIIPTHTVRSSDPKTCSKSTASPLRGRICAAFTA